MAIDTVAPAEHATNFEKRRPLTDDERDFIENELDEAFQASTAIDELCKASEKNGDGLNHGYVYAIDACNQRLGAAVHKVRAVIEELLVRHG